MRLVFVSLGHRGGAALDAGLGLVALDAGPSSSASGSTCASCSSAVHRGGAKRVERRTLPRGLAAVTALDRVNPRARRGGRGRSRGATSSPASGGAASVEISPEVSRP
ncbi:hypothetical protein [Polyangium jinanense]|uniref:Uncharacterized protein n=1 Tax=Polyangium jinanense TaxID=2829994 RepID=A0A9X3XFZ8_9BACT|nr:hypothetical protein [Polyangium jinanense]MDC3988393.1 hypothetical protein [Polyangium jinanense]